MLFLTGQHPLHAGREEPGSAGWRPSEVTYGRLCSEVQLLPEGSSLAVPARVQRAHEQPCAPVLSSSGLLSVSLAVLRGSRA